MIDFNQATLCPCGSSKKYINCCGEYIETARLPKTAEQLMRSRYTAYTLSKIDYIKKTMAGPALKKFNEKEALEWSQNSTWLKLEVLNHETDKSDPQKSYVEFKAYYLYNGSPQVLHECSVFKKVDSKWFYFKAK